MTIMNDSMRGLFFIIKGQYTKDLSPEFTNRVTGSTGYVGGYDPDLPTTREWYMLVDRKCFQCYCCGSNYEKVLKGVKKLILKYRGSAKRYFRYVSQTTSDDYYETHYLGHRELTPEKRAKKAVGRCPRTSPSMRCMYEEIDRRYGDYYRADIEKMEEEAYAQLVDERPVNKSRKIFQKARKSLGVTTPTPVETPKKTPAGVEPKEDIIPTLIKPKKRPVRLLRV